MSKSNSRRDDYQDRRDQKKRKNFLRNRENKRQSKRIDPRSLPPLDGERYSDEESGDFDESSSMVKDSWDEESFYGPPIVNEHGEVEFY